MSLGDKKIEKCLILTANKQLKPTIVSSVKSYGISSIESTESSESLIGKITDDPIFFVLDWEMGEKMCLRVLEAIKKKNLIGLVPIMAFGESMHPKMIAAGYEYSLSKVVVGDLTFKNIQDGISAAFEYEQQVGPIREVLIKLQEARANNDPMGAINVLKEGRLRYPNVDRLAVELAEEYIAKNEWQEAGALVAPLITKQPPYVRAFQTYAKVLLNEKDLDGAKNLLEKTQLLNPYNVDSLVQMGDLLISEGDLDDARVAFCEALEVDPSSKQAKQGSGKVELMEGNIDEAMGILRDISSPRELAAIFNLSGVYNIRQNEFAKAIELYKYALGLLKGDDHLQARLYFNAGLGFRKWDKIAEAKSCFEKAIELDPEYDKPKRNFEAIADNVPDKFDDEDESLTGSTAFSTGSSTKFAGKNLDPFEVADDFDSFDEFDEDSFGFDDTSI